MGGRQNHVPGTTSSEAGHVFPGGTQAYTVHTGQPHRESRSFTSTHVKASSSHGNTNTTGGLVPPFWLIRIDVCQWNICTPWLSSSIGTLALVGHSVWTSRQYNIHAQPLPPLRSDWLKPWVSPNADLLLTSQSSLKYPNGYTHAPTRTLWVSPGTDLRHFSCWHPGPQLPQTGNLSLSSGWRLSCATCHLV